jgi:hypothetical protein
MAAICDRYLPKVGGVVWDMCAGYGGRLTGSMVSDRVTRYVGSEPALLTMTGLCEMRDELPSLMRYMGYDPPEIELHMKGSEDYHPEPESLDLCFTSPPYGPRHEQYSTEPTQSGIRFPTNEKWLHGFMQMTLDNCMTGLKRDGILAINIASVKGYPTLQEDFVALAVANGWRLVETLQLALSKMVGTGKRLASFKFEPIYVFRKSSSVYLL